MIRGVNIAALMDGPAGAAVVALLVAVAGVLAARRWRWMADIAVPLAVLAGLVLLVPRPGVWVRPQGVVDHLVLPAWVLVAVGASQVWVGPRAGWWARVAGSWFGAWWVAGAAGGEFWRASAAVLALSFVLRWGRERLLAGAAVLWGGVMLAGGAAVLAGAAAVLTLVFGGAFVGSFAARGSATLLALGIVVAELGAGRLARGRIGGLEVACAAAVAAPFVAMWIERLAVRRGVRRPWVSRGLGVAGAVMLGVGSAWVAGRFWGGVTVLQSR